MSRKYKFHNNTGVYFVSFATIEWVDVFTRKLYNEILVESLQHCVEKLGMQLYCWCIMPNHVHLILSAENEQPAALLGRFKEFTSRQIVKAIKENPQESRKSWLMKMFEDAANKSSNVGKYQFWRHDNRPIEIFSSAVIKQKVDYLHNNPVVAGYVDKARYWKYSSAVDYAGGKGMVDVVIL